MSQFAVLLAEYESPSWSLAAEALVQVLALHPSMAKRQARNCGGFLAEHLAGAQAEQLREACAARGVQAQVVPQSAVVVLPRIQKAHELVLRDEGLFWRTDFNHPPQSIDWASIRLIAALQTTHAEEFHRYQVEKQGRLPEKLTVERYTERSAELIADVFYAAADTREPGRIRISERGLNYAQALGSDAPDELEVAKARQQAFRLVIARIGAKAPQAMVDAETLALLSPSAAQPLARRPARDMKEFESYNRWLLEKQRLEDPSGSPRKH